MEKALSKPVDILLALQAYAKSFGRYGLLGNFWLDENLEPRFYSSTSKSNTYKPKTYDGVMELLKYEDTFKSFMILEFFWVKELSNYTEWQAAPQPTKRLKYYQWLLANYKIGLAEAYKLKQINYVLSKMPYGWRPQGAEKGLNLDTLISISKLILDNKNPPSDEMLETIIKERI